MCSSASAFASYAGVAPIEVASGDHARHRLPRGGDRQLNLALARSAVCGEAGSGGWGFVGVGEGCGQAGQQQIEEAVEFGGAVVGG
jgi:Transposase IS116/IS110/IS902 family